MSPLSLGAGALASLAFLPIFFIISYGIGAVLIRRWVERSFSDLEGALLCTGLGMGVIAYEVLLLGLLGLLTQPVLMALVALNGVPAVGFLGRRAEWRRLRSRLRRPVFGSRFNATIAILGFASALMTLAMALVPPRGYDALMFHLEGPRFFLEAGRILPSVDQWWLNLPFTVEMLYLVGLAFGLESFSSLLHFAFAVLLILATFAIGKRLSSARDAWLAVAILLGILVMSAWASLANIDFGWAFFELLCLLALLGWRRSGAQRYLVLAGMYLGLALGSKYLALSGAAMYVLFVFFAQGTNPLRDRINSSAILAAAAGAIMLPWYLKNWLWLGDPVFPYLIGGARLNPDRMASYFQYIRQYGAIDGPLDALLLPVDIFLRPERFSETFPMGSTPNLLFLLAPFYLLDRKKKRTLILDLLLLLVVFRFVTWALGARNLRILLPMLPLVSLFAARGIDNLEWPAGGRLTIRHAAVVLAVLLVGISLLLRIALFLSTQPSPVLIGLESREDFLSRTVSTHRALRFASNQLPQGTRLLTTGNGRLYCCGELCVRTDDQSLWLRMLMSSEDAADFERQLHAIGASHVLRSEDDINFFVGLGIRDVEAAAARLDAFVEVCGETVYQDSRAAIYRLSCRESRHDPASGG